MNERAENEESAPERRKSGSMKSLLVWGVVGVVSIGGGFATPFAIDHFSGESAIAGTSGTSAAPPALVEFGEVVVNLNESRLNRYLKLNISLMTDEASSMQLTERVEKNKPILKSWLLGHLADKAMDDIRGATGQNQLRREIQNHFNAIMFPEGSQKVHNILFQEFNIQ
jgi:flagellar basal body-associated protein FliL